MVDKLVSPPGPGAPRGLMLDDDFLARIRDEIGSELGISVTNVHDILHRARLGLRACLEHNWFQPGAEPC